MGKRLMAMVVGAGMGALVGIPVSAMGAGNTGIVACAIAGAILPILVLGRPGK